MKKEIIISGLIFLTAAALFFWNRGGFVFENNPAGNISGNDRQKDAADTSEPEKNSSPNISNTPNAPSPPSIPMDKAKERILKKPFGIYVTPQKSPVQPERFKGYHTGTDFEIFPGEEDATVPVRAICDGNMRIGSFISGYGGVLVQSCQIETENVIVLYGHLSQASFEFKNGEKINRGNLIGNLGEPAKGETDRERKHLHLSIKKGSGIDYRGYVNSLEELSSWIDPCLYYCD